MAGGSPIEMGISCGIIPPTFEEDGITRLPQYGSCFECPYIVYTEFKKLEVPRQAYNIEFQDSGQWKVEEMKGIYITEEPIAGWCRLHGIVVPDFKELPECKFLESWRRFKEDMRIAERERARAQMDQLVKAGKIAAEKRLTLTGGM